MGRNLPRLLAMMCALALSAPLSAQDTLCHPGRKDAVWMSWCDIRGVVEEQINRDNQRWYDGYFFGGNPEWDPRNPDFDPSEEGVEKYWVANQRIDHPNTDYIHWAQQFAVQPTIKKSDDVIIYVNGINTTFESHHASLQLLADATGHPVLGVLNASAVRQRGGVMVDVLQTALDRRAPDSSDGTDLVVEPDANNATAIVKYTVIAKVAENYERQLLGQPRQPIYILAHSQGGAIVARALDEADRVLRDMRRQLIAERPELAGTNIPLDIRDVRYTGFGNAAPVWPSGPGLGGDGLGWYEHYVHVMDPTPIWLGLRNHDVWRNDAGKAGKWARVIRFQGEPKSGRYWPEIEALAARLRDKSEAELARTLAASLSVQYERIYGIDRARARELGLQEGAELAAMYWQKGRPTMEQAIDLVRYTKPDLITRHVADPIFREVEPGENAISNRVSRIDGEKFTLYHHVHLSYLKYWVQRNGLQGSKRPAWHDHPIWLEADSLSFMKSLRVWGKWSTRTDNALFEFPITGYNRSMDTVTLEMPEYFLSAADKKRLTVRKHAEPAFYNLWTPIPWGSELRLPRVQLQPATNGKSWSGSFSTERWDYVITLQNSGHFTMRAFDPGSGKLDRTLRGWTQPLR